MNILRAIVFGGLVCALAACTPSQPGANFLPTNATQNAGLRQAHPADNGAGGPVAHPLDNGSGGPVGHPATDNGAGGPIA